MALHRGGVEPVESDWVKEKRRAVRFTTLGGGDGFAVNTNVIMLMGGEVFVVECFFNDLKGYQGNTSSVERESTTELLKKKVHSHQSTICWIFNAEENMYLNVKTRGKNKNANLVAMKANSEPSLIEI